MRSKGKGSEMQMKFITSIFGMIHIMNITASPICAKEKETKIMKWDTKPSNINFNKAAWYKGDQRVAWLFEGKFNEDAAYEGRLRYIGDGSIEIKQVTTNDSGTYKFKFKHENDENYSETSLDLYVIDAATNTCKPEISQQGSSLTARLPSDYVCSLLKLESKNNKNKNGTIQNNTDILHLETDSGGEVCAAGEATKCFHGNKSDLCTKYQASHHQQNGDQGMVYLAVFISIGIFLVMLISSLVIWWICPMHEGSICLKSSERFNDKSDPSSENLVGHHEVLLNAKPCTVITIEDEQDVDSDLADLPTIIDFLKHYYQAKIFVPLSPFSEGKVSVSEVYESLNIQTKATEDTSINLCSTTSLISNNTLRTQSKLCPQFIIGSRGSGKSTCCKYLVYCWSKDETERQDLKLPPLMHFQVLLYLQLKQTDQGHSFNELLQQHLFPKKPSYFEFVWNLMNRHSLSQPILIIIDDLDKLSERDSQKLLLELQALELPSCTFIFTLCSNRLKMISDAYSDWTMKLHEISEMALEKSKSYIHRVVRVINQNYNKNLNPYNFLSFIKYLQVEGLLTSPRLCLCLLHIWLENKNPHIHMTDVVFAISKFFFNQKIHKGLEGDGSANLEDFLDSFSVEAFNVFKYEGKPSENVNTAHKMGFIIDSSSLYLDRKLTFTNQLIYQFLVSYVFRLEKVLTYDHIISDLETALKNSPIIHMVSQFSPAIGKEMFDKLNKWENKRTERYNELNKKYLIRQTNAWTQKEDTVDWLQNLLYRSLLDNKTLFFLSDALKFTDSLTVLDLKNTDDNENLIFWLPFIKTLKILKLSINKCTLLLCKEWEQEESNNLQEVKIESMIIHESTHQVLKALGRCSNLSIVAQSAITNINEIFCPVLAFR